MSTKPDSDDPTKKVADQVEAVKEKAAEHIEPKRTRNWRALAFQTFLVVGTISFGALLVLASMFNYFPIDLTITRGIQTFTVAWFARLMWWISFPGYAPQIFLFVASAGALLYTLGLRWEAVATLVSELTAGAVGELIKILVHRPRPGADLISVINQLKSYSFPSGHVLTYTVFFGFLFFLTFTLLKPSIGRTILLIIWGIMVALVGLSRIYLGNHWASDVAGAYLLGSIWLTLSIHYYRWGKKRFFVEQPLAPEKPGPNTVSKA